MDDTTMLHELSPYTTLRSEDIRRVLEFSPNYDTLRPKQSIVAGILTDNEFHVEKSAIADEDSTSRMVCGSEINEVPAKYEVKGLKPHELTVIGVYVDKHICPGFRYKVRYNESKEELFDGKARTLLTIGMGYGKRLTFAGNRLNNNENYFWSDSNPMGFSFSLEVVSVGDEFVIYNSQSELTGRVIVTSLVGPQTEIDQEMDATSVSKTVRVVLTCIVQYYQRHQSIDLYPTSLETIQGEVVMKKQSKCKLAKIECIRTNISRLGQCTLHAD